MGAWPREGGRAELGYRLRRSASGRGLAVEGAGSVVEDPLPGAELGEVIAEVTRQEWSRTEA